MTETERNFGKCVWKDGQILDQSEASVGMMTHALHYGSSAYEGIRIYNYQPFKLEAHLRRLVTSSGQLGIIIPYSIEEVVNACHDIIKANDIENGYMRPLVWRGQGRNLIIDGKTCPIHLMISGWKSFEEKRHDLKERGFNLQISHWIKPDPRSYPSSAKVSGVYMMATVVKNQADADGFDDALILDAKGNITECTTSNVFFIRENRLITPIPDCFLDGITRQTIINEVAPSLDILVEERHITLDELPSCTGGFLTGTAIEIGPIRSISVSDKKFEFTLPNPMITNLIRSFQQLRSSSDK